MASGRTGKFRRRLRPAANALRLGHGRSAAVEGLTLYQLNRVDRKKVGECEQADEQRWKIQQFPAPDWVIVPIPPARPLEYDL